jgi:hypothetical protein
MNRRHKKGSITAFGVVLAMVLVVLGGGFLFFILFMGGQREVKNAVDAGMLNIGKQVQDNISVTLSPSEDQRCFLDVTTDTIDSSAIGDGKVDLRRINRVWGEAMLMAINADAAGGNAGSGTSNAQSACQGAKDLSDALSDKLTTASNLFPFFTEFTDSNSVRMLGTAVKAKVLSGSGWQTSLMDRNSESNIVLNGSPPNFNLPPGYSLPNDTYTKSQRKNVPTEAGSYYFLKGYAPLTIAGNTFWQVPYQYDEKPHMVAKSEFDAHTVSAEPISWDKAVPNGFSGEGEAQKGNSGEKALSCVLTNPRQPFQLAIPHGFVKIHLDQMQAHWKFFPTAYPPVDFTQSDYGYIPDTQSGTPMPQGGVLCSLVSPGDTELGLDVAGRTLDGVIFSDFLGGDKSTVESYLVNRCNEMITKPGMSVSASDVHSALSNPISLAAMVSGAASDFYLYSPDGASLTCLPQAAAIAKSPWLALTSSNDPDGTEKQLVDDDNMPMFAGFPTATPDPFCTVDLELGWATWDESIWWTPGTGYNSCLGTLRVKHWTDVFSLGVATPVI